MASRISLRCFLVVLLDELQAACQVYLYTLAALPAVAMLVISFRARSK